MAEEQNLKPERNEPNPVPPVGTESPAEPQGPATSKELTPGQRLAARKALKATKKKEFREELKEKEREAAEQAEAPSVPPEGPALPEEVQQVARDFSDFAHENQGRIVGGIAAFVLLSAAIILGQRLMNSGNAEAAAELEAAVTIASAAVDAEDKDGKTEDGKPVYASSEARAKKAAEAFAAVSKKHGDESVAPWADLGQAAAQTELKAYAKARGLYESALAGGKDDPAVVAQALEGLGLSLEALGQNGPAMKRFEELKALAGDHNRATAEYHIARLKFAGGDREGAKGMLKALYDRLRKDKDGQDGQPKSAYLFGEVERRLAAIDPSLVESSRAGADGATSFTPEQLQRLMEQLNAGKGAPPGGGGAGAE